MPPKNYLKKRAKEMKEFDVLGQYDKKIRDFYIKLKDMLSTLPVYKNKLIKDPGKICISNRKYKNILQNTIKKKEKTK